jgi:branched-chain amino acid transport system substrate-binding protein
MLLGSTLALAGCLPAGEETFVPPGRGTTSLTPTGPVATVTGGVGNAIHVALLVPLTGDNAAKGNDLMRAAQLALSAPDSPSLDVKDTGGTPAGAAEAARHAIAGGDVLILGPLTSAETAAVAPVAKPSNVPVLAFTSDSTQAQEGVWVLGLTPGQQVRRLVAAAQEQGKTRIAAVLPQNALGQAMADSLTATVASDGLPPPRMQTYGAGMSALNEAVRTVSDYADRRGPLDAAIHAARSSGDPAARRAATQAARQPLPPLPIDALLLGDTGTPLAELGTLLPYYDVTGIQIMGPALWAQETNRADSGGILRGAWYAAPDPAARAGFVQTFTARYSVAPSVLADFAYDAASIARVTAQSGGVSLAASLTRPGGFSGVDGTLLLLPGGKVLRSLAVFQLSDGGASIISPAPAVLTAPSS